MAKIRVQKFGSGTVDMAFLNSACLRSPHIIKNLYTSDALGWGVDSPFTVFVQNLLAINGISSMNSEETLASGLVRWQIKGHTHVENRILWVSNSAPKAGQTFEVVISNAWFRNGATLRTSVLGHNLYLVDNGIVVNNGTRYQAQYVAPNKDTVAPPAVLKIGNKVEYLSGVYGEASETGHPIGYHAGGDWLTNIMTIQRHKAQWTGSAASEILVYEDEANGLQDSYMLPLFKDAGGDVVRRHLRQVERYKIFGVGNFDPVTGDIVNRNLNGEFVPMGDGLIQQFENAYPVSYDINDDIASIAAKLKIARQHILKHTGAETVDIYGWGGFLAREIMTDVFKYESRQTGIQYFEDVKGGDEMTAGLTFRKLKDHLGTVNFMLSTVFDEPTSPSPQISYNGVSYNAESGEIYLMFVTKMSDGKPNIRVYSKGKNGLMRSLVFGYVKGMTGMFNGMPKAQKSLEEYNSYLVSTGLDADQFEVLTEDMLILTNPTEFAVMKPYRL